MKEQKNSGEEYRRRHVSTKSTRASSTLGSLESQAASESKISASSLSDILEVKEEAVVELQRAVNASRVERVSSGCCKAISFGSKSVN